MKLLWSLNVGKLVQSDVGAHTDYQVGYGAGYTEAKDEKTATAWASTPEGRTAYRFAQSGELQLLPPPGCRGRRLRMGDATNH
jgi:hypothetical protein